MAKTLRFKDDFQKGVEYEVILKPDLTINIRASHEVEKPDGTVMKLYSEWFTFSLEKKETCQN